MIPLHFYFTYYRGNTNWAWTDIHTLCLKSCKRNSGATKITVFYDRDGEGYDWDEARALANIEWIPTTFTAFINGIPVKDQRLIHDVHRLQTLWERGGYYADLDFVFLKHFEGLSASDAVIGTQCKAKKKLNCSIMGCAPGSSFIKSYIDAYKLWTHKHEKEFWTYANTIPWALSQTMPVTVLAKRAFMPVSWSNKSFWEGKTTCLKFSYAVHLWESLHPDLRVADLLKTDLRPFIEDIINDIPRGLVHLQQGIIVNFD